jgi:hypothetical protein
MPLSNMHQRLHQLLNPPYFQRLHSTYAHQQAAPIQTSRPKFTLTPVPSLTASCTVNSRINFPSYIKSNTFIGIQSITLNPTQSLPKLLCQNHHRYQQQYLNLFKRQLNSQQLLQTREFRQRYNAVKILPGSMVLLMEHNVNYRRFFF